MKLVGVALAFALVPAGGCSERRALTSCRDDLAGTYVTESGERWMILEGQGKARGTIEAYPLFDDGRDPAAPAGIEVAPRVIDAKREGSAVRGKVHRRYMMRSEACDGSAPATITACTGQTLEIVLGGPTPPLSYTPCQLGTPLPSRRERWTRE